MRGNFDETYHHIEAPTVSNQEIWKTQHKRVLYVPELNDNLPEYYSTKLLWYLSTLPWNYKRKFDGSNIRVKWDGNRVLWNGKTNNFTSNTELDEYMSKTFPEELFEEKFGRESTVLLFGELMGPKVQGNSLNLEKREVILFDVKINKSWLNPQNVQDIAQHFWLRDFNDFMPSHKPDTLINLIHRVKEGEFADWEGIVSSPLIGCQDFSGHRVICKIKNQDYLPKS